MKFDDILIINNKELNKKYIESLSKKERLDLVEKIFIEFRKHNFIYPDDLSKVDKEWKRLLKHKPDLNITEIFNNSSLATFICKYFCKEFYNTTEMGKRGMIELFNDDDILQKTIKNRLGLDWLDDDFDKNGNLRPGVNEAFPICFRQIIQGFRSQRLIVQSSIFKPDIAMFLYQKYSNPGDTIFDYSVGWGGRILGAAATANRTYIGTDPLTTTSVGEMANYLKFNTRIKYELINSGSEHYRGKNNSVDFIFSSPPYLTKKGKQKEIYKENDLNQASSYSYNDFHDKYWRKTLENCKFMLKPNKIFGLNITADCEDQLKIAKEIFGEIDHLFPMRLVKSHLSGKSKEKNNSIKYEYIYLFKNKK